MNKICVYTCITGDYDNLIEIENVEEGIDYICYTNNKSIKSNTWKVKYISDDELSNVELARKTKILGTPDLKQYDMTVWIDGRIYFTSSIKSFIDKFVDLDNFDLVTFKHFCRTTINNEINACYEIGKISIEDANKLTDFYKSEKYPDNNGLVETTLLFRNFNNKNMIKSMKDWFDMILKFTYRDQLSFNYVIWKNDLKVKCLDINIWDNEYFNNYPHKKEAVKFSIIPSNKDNFKFTDIDVHFIAEDGNKEFEYIIKDEVDRLELLFNTKKKLVLVNFEVFVNDNKIDDYKFENCEVNGSKIYFTNLPQIFINHKFNKNDKVTIKYYLEAINSYDSNKILFEVENDLLKLNKDYSNLDEKNQKMKSEIEDIRNTIAELNQEVFDIRTELDSTSSKYKKIVESKRWQKLNKLLKMIGK